MGARPHPALRATLSRKRERARKRSRVLASLPLPLAGEGRGEGACARRSLPHRIQRQIQRQHVHPRLAEHAEQARRGVRGDQVAQRSFVDSARLRHARDLERRGGGRDVGVEPAARGGDEVAGDRRAGVLGLQLRPRRPSPDRPAPSRSARDWSRRNCRRHRARARSCSGPSGPARSSPTGADGSSVGSAKFWPISAEPIGLPSRSMRLPFACQGNATWAMPVMASG